MKKRLLISGLAVLALGGAGYFWVVRSRAGARTPPPTVRVQRGSIVDRALAVGTIEPENEISVKSKVEGVVKRIFAEEGTYVKAGDPLIEVKPDPAPLELAEAKRALQLVEVEMGNLAKERVRQETLSAKRLISARDYENFQRTFEEAELRGKIAREKLALLESGRVRIGDTEIESIIKAPVDGYVLNRKVEVGDPVTPLTSYQEGTVLMRIANMKRLLFKGTVDEIDAGKLREGMEAEIKMGALPNEAVRGTLHRISLKADKKDNTTVFPVEIFLDAGNAVTLRAGYSANASIIVKKKERVLTLPERVVTFRNDSAFVKVPTGPEKEETRQIRTGLSDAINLEVVSGLKEGDEVLEKPVKKIE